MRNFASRENFPGASLRFLRYMPTLSWQFVMARSGIRRAPGTYVPRVSFYRGLLACAVVIAMTAPSLLAVAAVRTGTPCPDMVDACQQPMLQACCCQPLQPATPSLSAGTTWSLLSKFHASVATSPVRSGALECATLGLWRVPLVAASSPPGPNRLHLLTVLLI